MLRFVKTIVLSAALAGMCVPAMGQDWVKSPWGPDDEAGAANRINAESVMAASKLIKTGKIYSLGMIIDSKIPAYPPRNLSLAILQPNQIDSTGMGPKQSTYNDDIFTGWLGIGSQIDGLGHVGVAHTYYNGNKGKDFAKAGGLTKLGVEKIPPIAARGIVLDMAAFYGQPILDAGKAFTKEDIIAAAKAQSVEIREGDVVLFHTGWMNLLYGDNPEPGKYGPGEPGLGLSGAEYLAEIGVVAIGADTWGVEAVPFPEGTGVFEIHQVLLAHNGIYILENMVTQPLVDDGVKEFMFVLGAARLRGAVQMMINPIAIH